jgi:hypothetical protein
VLAVCVAALGDAVVAHAVSKLKSATTARLIVLCFSGVVLIVFMLRIYAARSDRRYRACARFFNATREVCDTPSFEIAANSNDIFGSGRLGFPEAEIEPGGSVRWRRNGSHRQDAACAGRFRSMLATNSGMLIGLARNGCPWISRPRPSLVSVLNELEVSVAMGAHLHCSPSLLPTVECGILIE